MGFFRVLEPGMLTIVQDLGREGVSALGVPRGGAADPFSLRVGNRLVANPDNTPAVEMTLTGGTFVFDHDALIVLAGADVTASIESPDLPPRTLNTWTSTRLRAGQTLRVGPLSRGARLYLCIGGGLNVPTVLGAASTLLGAGFGGLDGRALRAGDRLEYRESQGLPRALKPDGLSFLSEALDRRTIRAVPGAHRNEFDATSFQSFWTSTYTVTNRSDRVGLTLDGPAIVASPTAAAGRLISEGMPPGTVQVPPAGRPIVLLVDHPTTGGYPAIACVASVDLHVLGQLRPHDQVRFEQVSIDHARDLFRKHQRALDAQIPA